MPRAQVFPGGRIDTVDSGRTWDDLSDMTEAEAEAVLGTTTAAGVPARAFLVGAVREVFEETGVLLGLRGAEVPDAGWLQATRRVVHESEETFAAVLRVAGLRLRLHELVPFARWVTPEGLPKRYDTFFFAAPMPPAQEAIAAPGEIASLEWVTPAMALARADSRVAYTLPPTRAALTALAPYATVADALNGIGAGASLEPILPRVVNLPEEGSEAGISVLMPGDPGYEERV